MTTDGLGSDLTEFCRGEWPRLVGSLGLYIGDREAAEEIAQETLARVTEKWNTVRTTDSPSAWAHRVAFNLAKSSFRRNAVRRRAHPQSGDSDVTRTGDIDGAIAVRDALAILPEPQRRALVLRYFADLSVYDTAHAMGCPENTVKTHTRRGLEALRMHLRDLADDEAQEDAR